MFVTKVRKNGVIVNVFFETMKDAKMYWKEMNKKGLHAICLRSAI